MSSELSPTAARSIRQFSIGVWIVGTVVAMVMAFVMLPQFMIDQRTGAIGLYPEGGGAAAPWRDDDPTEFERADSSVSGEGSGFISLTADDTEPLELRAERIAGFTSFSISLASQREKTPDARDYPLSLGYVSEVGDTTLVIPPGADTELWIEAEGRWRFALHAIETTPIDDAVSGTGNAYLAYRGTALSARFEHHGSGIFFVSIISVGFDDRPIIETDEVDERLSWDPSPLVVFAIEADTGDGEWTVTIDRLADDGPPSDGPPSDGPPAEGDPPSDDGDPDADAAALLFPAARTEPT